MAVVAWFTALVTTSLMPALGHSMNMVTIVMPTLLVVLTISATIHIINYWRESADEGGCEPIAKAVKMGARPCLLATVTTAIGIGSLIISKLGPIRDFGTFSMIGVLLSFVVFCCGGPGVSGVVEAGEG